ncbi:UAP56-interacting factor-like [Lampris incognitus]|uniref:UAP56-interacting factor-like n=1 Tax=Lampris incognitus TaxID=2546036 RepID=UPI0024B5D4BB|nr:UAP56-interacting factor-like [Lampris incognitus]
MSENGSTAGRGKKSAVPDKVDMSLDDIIRLNKKEQQSRRRRAIGNRRPVPKKGRTAQGKGITRAGGPVQRGSGVSRGRVTKLRGRRVPPPVGRRRGQGVITGLAARRPAALQKGTSLLNRTAVAQKTRPFIQYNEAQYRRSDVQRKRYRAADPQRGQNTASVRRPFQLQRRPLPPVHQAQREARQATFLIRRGLKIHAQVQKPNQRTAPVRTRQWRTSTNGSGILTVSIDNPTARTQPEPPSAWSLHPPAVSFVPVKTGVIEKKTPKGVALQFDINSVGKPQTAMTLNERFRILKDQRTATAQSNKGSRFVTVG